MNELLFGQRESLPPDMLMLHASAVQWTARLVAVAALVNAIELLWLIRHRAILQIWRATELADERGWARGLLTDRAFVLMLGLQGAAALSLWFVPHVLASALVLCTTFLCARWARSNVNGGSDGMLFTVVAGLTLATAPFVNATVHEGALLFVAAQLTLSYARAGLVKIREPRWWTGEALRDFLAIPAYGAPIWFPRHPMVLRIASISVLAVECVFPIVWFVPAVLPFAITVAVCFHLAVAATFGLNRFVWAWAAAMPALWYSVQRAQM